MELLYESGNFGGQQFKKQQTTSSARGLTFTSFTHAYSALGSCIYHKSEENRHRFVLGSFVLSFFALECDLQMNWRRFEKKSLFLEWSRIGVNCPSFVFFEIGYEISTQDITQVS